MLGLCVQRLGYRRGARVAEFIGEWEVCVRKHGREVGAEEFVAWWKDSRATTYRRLVEFREAFPELGLHGTPGDLMRPLLAQLHARDLGQEVDLDSAPLVVPS